MRRGPGRPGFRRPLVSAPPVRTKKQFEWHVSVSLKYSGDGREEEAMSRAIWRGCLAVLFLASGTALVGGQEKLEWTAFNGKEKFYQEMTTTTEQKMTV